MQQQHDEALALCLECYKLCERVNWAWMRAVVAQPIGYLYFITADREQGRHYTFESYRTFEELGDRFGMLSLTNNLTAIAGEDKDWQTVGKYCYQGFEMACEYDISERITVMASSIAWFELTINHNEQLAEHYAQESLRASRFTQDKSFRSVCYGRLASIALAKGDHGEALRLAEIAHDLAQQGGQWTHLTAARSTLGLAQAIAGKYDESLKMAMGIMNDANRAVSEYYRDVLSIFALNVAHRGNHAYAIELLGLVLRHTGENHLTNLVPELRGFQDELRQTVGDDVYQSLLERGKSLDIQAVIKALADEFGGQPE